MGLTVGRTEPALKEGELEQREQRIQKGCNGTCWGAKGDRPQSSTSSNLHPFFHPRLPPSDLTSNSKGNGDLRWLSLSQIMKEDSLMRETKDQRSRGTSSGCQFGPEPGGCSFQGNHPPASRASTCFSQELGGVKPGGHQASFTEGIVPLNCRLRTWLGFGIKNAIGPSRVAQRWSIDL